MFPRLMTATIAMTLVAAPLAAQVAPVGSPRAEAVRQFNEGVVSDNKAIDLAPASDSNVGSGVATQPTYYQRAPRVTGQVIGGQYGDASERATAYRGDYRFGECPAGTIITTFGTCAVTR
ncbi:hypothetical protein [Jannaschia sp. 2305UL9-9]|uniref:hypothetical protein n=1 Tax=Jannaschia sp. 2305UL9-9 TaxID=3121638 RepID=UPI003527EFDB